MKRIALFLLPILSGLLVSCMPMSPVTPEPFRSSIAPTESLSPVSTPAAQVTYGPLSPAFKLDPVTVDSTEATGQGPVGLTLVIVDSTSGAKILGTGKADAQGNFRIPLSEAPREGHIIGLTVDVPPEQLASPEFMERLFEARGPGFRIVPQVVIIYDGVEVP